MEGLPDLLCKQLPPELCDRFGDELIDELSPALGRRRRSGGPAAC